MYSEVLLFHKTRRRLNAPKIAWPQGRWLDPLQPSTKFLSGLRFHNLPPRKKIGVREVRVTASSLSSSPTRLALLVRVGGP